MSSKSDTAISCRGLSKAYTIVRNGARHTTAAEALVDRLRNPLQRPQKETFWALKDIDFDIRRGEVVGIIGRNGAGKSTLLKILSRITEPTAGRAVLHGRVGSLLEVGTGFHAELTGRENIYLNGSILGMSRREIDRHFDDIVDFAEVARFLDTPVKRYSSGMFVRLAFAVAAHLNPEILIVDEVLAVGDAEFQRRCLGKMHDVAEQEGRTVLFVSHNMTAVQGLCGRCVLLSDGAVHFDGETGEAVRRYQSLGRPVGAPQRAGEYDLTGRDNRHLPGTLIVRKVAFRNANGETTDTVPMGQPLSIVIDVAGLSGFKNAIIGVNIKSDLDHWLVGFNTEMKPPRVEGGVRGGDEQVVLHIPRVPLTPGTYSLDIDVDQKNIATLDGVERAAHFTVTEADVYGSGYRVELGVLYLDAEWQIRSRQACPDPSCPGGTDDAAAGRRPAPQVVHS